MTDKTLKGGLRRRDFLATGAAAFALGVTGFPAVLRAQATPVKIGLIHPVSGFVAFSGNQCREGALPPSKQVPSHKPLKLLRF